MEIYAVPGDGQEIVTLPFHPALGVVGAFGVEPISTPLAQLHSPSPESALMRLVRDFIAWRGTDS